jgi:hypothetical protein
MASGESGMGGPWARKEYHCAHIHNWKPWWLLKIFLPLKGEGEFKLKCNILSHLCLEVQIFPYILAYPTNKSLLFPNLCLCKFFYQLVVPQIHNVRGTQTDFAFAEKH